MADTRPNIQWKQDSLPKQRPNPSGFLLLILGIIVVCMAAVVAPGFSSQSDNPSAADPIVQADPNTFRIVAESEVKSLEDAGILADFTEETGVKLTIGYKGPVDIKTAVDGLADDNPDTV